MIGCSSLGAHTTRLERYSLVQCAPDTNGVTVSSKRLWKSPRVGNDVKMVILDGFRSTKGASKQRRDLINVEISNLRDLLPLAESSRQRLSQLQVMSLTCCYIRKCNYFAKLFGNLNFTEGQPFDFSQSMTGFMIITTREGKLLYISENVTEYLGHSMVDIMTQGDSVYDIIDKRDHAVVQGHLLSAATAAAAATALGTSQEEERSFFCRMNLSRSFRRQSGFGESKVMHVSGHFIQPVLREQFGNQPVFIAMCSPLVTPDGKDTLAQNNTMVFHSVHGLDMKFIEVDTNGEYHLGFNDSELYGRSWYEMLHPEDLLEAKEKHIQLIKSSHEMGCMLTVRLQTKDGQWVWVNTVMNIRQPFLSNSEEPAIVCINQVIVDGEAQQFKLQSQLYSSHIARSPEFLTSSQASSPPHTITQVSVEQDTGAYAHEKPSYSYEAEFTFTSLSSDDQAGPGKPSTLTTPYSDSGNDYNATPTAPLRRADIINRLKRKMEQSNQYCKPKVTRFQSNCDGDNSSSGSFSSSSDVNVAGSAFILGGYDALPPMQSATLAEAVDMMGPVISGHMFAELNLKKHVQQEVQVAPHLADFPQPLTPPTPNSVASDSHTMTKLTVDVCEVPVTVPGSILTPENSPASSPDHCVPSVYDIDDTLMPDFEESIVLSPKAEKPVKAVTEKPVQFSLPELDLNSLVTFLASVEQPGVAKPRMVVVPPLAPTPVVEEQTLEQQFTSLMASVNEVFMEHNNSAGINFVGGFQVVPNVQAPPYSLGSPMQGSPMQGSPMQGSSMQGSPQSECSDDTTLSDEDFVTIRGNLLNELSELNTLAASSPSYGEEAIPTTVFDPNL